VAVGANAGAAIVDLSKISVFKYFRDGFPFPLIEIPPISFSSMNDRTVVPGSIPRLPCSQEHDGGCRIYSSPLLNSVICWNLDLWLS
jgi:hypothetical protein